MDSDNFPEVAAAAGVGAVLTAVALSPPVRRTIRRGLVVGLAGMLAVTAQAKKLVHGLVQEAGGSAAAQHFATEAVEAGTEGALEAGGGAAVKAAF
jgi:hypothetical protein